jgi:hypothetical protein
MTRTARRALALMLPLALGGAAPVLAASHTLPVDTVLPVKFETTVSSATSRAEEKVLARLREPVKVGAVTLPEGSELRGHVISVRRPGKVSGRAYLSLAFTELAVGSKTYAISTRRISLEAPPEHGKDAKVIGGSAGAGAIVGAVVDGGEGAAKGALVGGAAGTGVVLATRGKDVSIPAGSRWRVRLVKPLVVD